MAKLLLFLPIFQLILPALSLTNGDVPEKFNNLTYKSVVLVDNGLHRLKTKENLPLPKMCSGSVITPWHVLTSAFCCSDKFKDQRIGINLNSDPVSSSGEYVPVKSHVLVGMEPMGYSTEYNMLTFSLCIIRLEVRTSAPSLNLPAEDDEHKEGDLDAYGYGANFEMLGTGLLKGAVYTLRNPEECLKIFGMLTHQPVVPKFYCMFGANTMMTMYDHGGPLVNSTSGVILGTAITLFGDFFSQNPGRSFPQLFLPIAAFRKRIDAAIISLE